MDAVRARLVAYSESSADSAATGLGMLADVSGVITPFHSRKTSPRLSRPPIAAQPQRGNSCSRVRRRSPLCHDVLEFMLDGASASSQESLVVDSAAAALRSSSNSSGQQHAQVAGPNAHAARSDTPTDSPTPEASRADVAAVSGRDASTGAGAASPCASSGRQGVHATRPADSHAAAEALQHDEQADDSDDGLCDSDSSGDDGSDDGFDGQYSGQSDGLSLTATTESTAECSRSGSYRSSRSNGSDASDGSSSTSTEPSLTWWKRHFRSKSKPQAQAQAQPADLPGLLLRRSTVGAQSRPRPVSAVSNSSIAPMLTRLKRSVSTKSAAKKPPAPEPKKARAEAAAPGAPAQSRLARASFISGSLLSRSKSTSAKPTPLPPATAPPKAAAAPSSVAVGSADVPKRPQTADSVPEDKFVARWTMLKCKGMENLHVVSVPASFRSLNHRDTFLFYPCLFHTLDSGQSAARALPPPAAEDGAAELGSEYPTAFELTSAKRVHSGALLAQEYSRRKSVGMLASRTIYVWLGAHASAIKRDAVTRVAMEIRDRELMGKAAVVVVDESAGADSARGKFFAQLHLTEHGGRIAMPRELSALSSQITPLSRAGDDLDFERALQRRKVMYGFWEAVPPATIVAAGAYVNAAALAKVPAGGAVVLDTWSDVFVWWRNEPCNPAVRRCAVSFAAALVRDVSIPPRPSSAAVWHETQGSEHVVFKTKFPDWPFVFAASMGAAEVVRQPIADSGATLPPMALPARAASRHSRPVAVA